MASFAGRPRRAFAAAEWLGVECIASSEHRCDDVVGARVVWRWNAVKVALLVCNQQRAAGGFLCVLSVSPSSLFSLIKAARLGVVSEVK
jgi:hypothetical protein